MLIISCFSAIILPGDIMKSLRYVEYNENILSEDEADRIDSLIGEIIAKNEPHTRPQADFGNTNTLVGKK